MQLFIEPAVPVQPHRRGQRAVSGNASAIVGGLILLSVTIGPASAASCEELKGMKVSGGIVTGAEHIEKGSIPAGGRGAITPPLPQYCRVTATLSSGPGSKIGIELWLPDLAEWNRKFLGTGNGGICRLDCSGRPQNRTRPFLRHRQYRHGHSGRLRWRNR